jgi:hypothetical protein
MAKFGPEASSRITIFRPSTRRSLEKCKPLSPVWKALNPFFGLTICRIYVSLTLNMESVRELNLCFVCKFLCLIGAVCTGKTINCRRDRQDAQDTDNDKLLACCSLLCSRLGFLPLSLRQSFAANPAITTGPDHRSEHVVRDLHAADTVSIFIGKQPGVHQLI